MRGEKVNRKMRTELEEKDHQWFQDLFGIEIVSLWKYGIAKNWRSHGARYFFIFLQIRFWLTTMTRERLCEGKETNFGLILWKFFQFFNIYLFFAFSILQYLEPFQFFNSSTRLFAIIENEIQMFISEHFTTHILLFLIK